MSLDLNDFGIAVGFLHQALLELGYSIGPEELRASRYGATTLAAVLEFQSVHVGKRGASLSIDGVVGPETYWALENPRGPVEKHTAPGWRFSSASMRPEARPACMAAICDIGKREDGHTNSGPGVKKFDTRGLPWCAMAVSAWLEATDGGSPLAHRMRSVAKVIEWAEARRRLVGPAEAMPGDVWCALRADGHGHCELVVGVEPAGYLCLVGGNVGNAVRGTRRRADAATHVVRAIPLI